MTDILCCTSKRGSGVKSKHHPYCRHAVRTIYWRREGVDQLETAFTLNERFVVVLWIASRPAVLELWKMDGCRLELGGGCSIGGRCLAASGGTYYIFVGGTGNRDFETGLRERLATSLFRLKRWKLNLSSGLYEQHVISMTVRWKLFHVLIHLKEVVNPNYLNLPVNSLGKVSS